MGAFLSVRLRAIPGDVSLRDRVQQQSLRREAAKPEGAMAAALATDMPQPQLFFREAGAGSGVVCIHGNASSSAQWRGLMDVLAPKFRVLAPDSYDSGRSAHWPSDRVIQLRDEVALIEPVLSMAGSPLALVGHSYGAAVALVAALAKPSRVRAMAIFEPQAPNCCVDEECAQMGACIVH